MGVKYSGLNLTGQFKVRGIPVAKTTILNELAYSFQPDNVPLQPINTTFGKSVTVTNSYVVVGAPHYRGSDIRVNQGAVAVYSKATMTKLYELTDLETYGSGYNYFGMIVDATDTHLAVLASGHKSSLYTSSYSQGQVFVYDITDGTLLFTYNQNTDGFPLYNTVSYTTINSIHLTSTHLYIGMPGRMLYNGDTSETGLVQACDLTTGQVVYSLTTQSVSGLSRHVNLGVGIKSLSNGNIVIVSNDQSSGYYGIVYCYDSTLSTKVWDYRSTQANTYDWQNTATTRYDTLKIDPANDYIYVGEYGQSTRYIEQLSPTTGSLLNTFIGSSGTNFGTVFQPHNGALYIPQVTSHSYITLQRFDTTTTTNIGVQTVPIGSITTKSASAYGATLFNNFVIDGDSIYWGAYIFDDDYNGQGALIKLDISNGGFAMDSLYPCDITLREGIQFGISCSVCDSYSAFGASRYDEQRDYTDPVASNVDSGVVYVYDNKTGALVTELHNPGTAPTGDLFGSVLEFSPDGSKLVVKNSNSPTSLYVYNTNDWSVAYIISNTNANTSGYVAYKHSLAVSNDYIVAGHHTATSTLGTVNAGQVYVYSLTDGTLINTIDSPDVSFANFGRSVATYGDTVVISHYNAPYNGYTGHGRVYVYSASTGNQITEIISNLHTTYMNFGTNIGVNGSYIVADYGTTNIDYVDIYNVSDGSYVTSVSILGGGTNAPLALTSKYLVTSRYGDTTNSLQGGAQVFSTVDWSLLYTIDGPSIIDSAPVVDSVGWDIGATDGYIVMSTYTEGSTLSDGMYEGAGYLFK